MQQDRTGRRRGLLAIGAAVAATAAGGFVLFDVLTAEAVGGPKPAARPVQGAKAPDAPAPQGTTAPDASAPQPAVATAPEPQPTQHARNAGVRDCLAGIDEVSRLSVTGNAVAVSTWNQGAPNDRLFNAIVGQSNDSRISPKAASVLVTAPTAQHACDATTVEIRPSALSCPEIERRLAQDKREQRVSLSGIPLLQADPSLRYILLPAVSSGCVVVGVRTLYGK